MKALFVFAHPDDESFSSGGTIAKLTKKGVIVKLITATYGEAGRTGNPPLTTQEKLGSVREQELRRAGKILGISQIFFLGLIDGTLHKIPAVKIADKIFSILHKEQPDIVVTFNKEGGSKHTDHIQVSKAVTLAFKRFMKLSEKRVRLYYVTLPRSLLKKLEEGELGYNVYGKIKGTPDHHITTAIDIKDSLPVKIKALKAHQTQHQDWKKYLKRFKAFDIRHEYFELILETSMV